MTVAEKNKRLVALRKEQDSWTPHWEELQQNFLPRRGRFLGRKGQDQANQGDKRNQRIINGTPLYAVRTLASGMMAGLTSPARPWFQLAPSDPGLARVEGVRYWLWDVQQRMRDVFARSNFYQSLFMIYAELATFGVSAQLIQEDDEDVIRVYPFTIGSYAIGQSARLSVNTLYREFQMTTQQLVQMFGNNCSTTVKQQYAANQLDQWHWVVHAVEQRKDRQSGYVDARNMAVSSCYYERNQTPGDPDKYLRESGYEEWPIQAPRWEVTGEDIYGSSPAMYCLGAAKSLQLQERRKAKAIDKLVDPPMVAHPELKHQKASLLPGDVTYASFAATGGSPAFVPAYQIKPELNNLLDDIRQSTDEINEAMYKDLFLMMTMSDRREITAREIEERHEEKLLMLGPVLERLNDELLDPAIDRTFSIMLRRGMIPPPPPELANADLKIEYISVLAQAQRSTATAGIERLSAYVLSLAELKPEAADKVNFDVAVEEYGEAVGVSPKMIHSDDEVEAIRAQRAQEQQLQMMAAAAEPLERGTQAVKNLSDSQVNGQNALEAIAGG